MSTNLRKLKFYNEILEREKMEIKKVVAAYTWPLR